MGPSCTELRHPPRPEAPELPLFQWPKNSYQLSRSASRCSCSRAASARLRRGRDLSVCTRRPHPLRGEPRTSGNPRERPRSLQESSRTAENRPHRLAESTHRDQERADRPPARSLRRPPRAFRERARGVRRSPRAFRTGDRSLRLPPSSFPVAKRSTPPPERSFRTPMRSPPRRTRAFRGASRPFRSAASRNRRTGVAEKR
jgi:hypothetical protein